MQSFVEGRLSRQRRRELQGHIESCADCYEASVELAHQLDCEQEPESSQLLLTRESDSTWVAEEPPTSQAPTSRRNDKLLDPGAMVDHFRVIRLLGRGSMGAVYLARDTELGRKVALKIVRDSSARRGQTLQRFAQEARTTAKFNHPHIVTVYAVGEIQGLPYVALEYLEGQNLMERMAEQEIGLPQALRICLAIAEAITEAHRHNVQHRDLKPANVLLPHDGRVRVVDFGLAHVAPDSHISFMDIEGLSMLETDGQSVCGTPAYMAPEQWLGHGTSPASDVWAIGLLLHELCTTQLPYIENQILKLFHAVTGPDPVPVCEDRERLPGPVAELVAQCLDKDPKGRPSAQQATDALRDLVYTGQRRLSEDESPFRGLLPFSERHAALFFGRDAEVDACVERLRHDPVLILVGPSGAGKSSLVQAGVVPRLREQDHWLMLSVRPGDEPLQRIARRVARARAHVADDELVTVSDDVFTELGSDVADRPEAPLPSDQEIEAIVEQIAQSPRQLGAILRALAVERNAKILLFVDQLEELFTLEHQPDTERSFMRAITTAADEAGDPVRVIVAMRDDFLGRAGCSGREVREALGQLMVVAPPDDEMQEQILREPLRAAGYTFDDPELVTDMVSAAQGAAPLPLLQFTARRLWDERDRSSRVLCRAAYEAMGGVAGALVGHADSVLRGLSSAELALTREILLRLVTPDRTRRVLSEHQILDGLHDNALPVLNRLTKARLVTAQRSEGNSGGEAQLELAHESLVESWGTLASWIGESRDELGFLAECEQAAQLWEKRGRRETELWQGDGLDDALRRFRNLRSEPVAVVRRFLKASGSRQRRITLRQRLSIGGLFVILAAAAGISWWQKLAADELRKVAEHQRGEAQQRRAEALLEGAVAAHERENVLEARAKLRMAAEQMVQSHATVRGLWWQLARDPLIWSKRIGTQAFGVAVSPDSDTIAVGALDAGVYLVNSKTTQTRVLRGHPNQVKKVDFAPSGKQLASGDWDGGLRVWDLEDQRALRTLPVHRGGVKALRYSPDGTLLAAADGDGLFFLWDPASGAEKRRFPGHRGVVDALAFSSDGHWIASGSRDKTVRMWSVNDGALIVRLEGHEGAVQSVAISRDRKLLASAANDGTIRLWDIVGNAQPRVLVGSGMPLRSLAFSPDDTQLAASDAEGEIVLWNVQTGREKLRLEGHTECVNGVAFGARNDRLASVSHDGTVRWWRLDLPPRERGEGHSEPVYGIAFSPDGNTIASGAADATVRIWNALSGEQQLVLRGHAQNVNTLAFGPGGKRLMTGSNDRSIRLWDLETGAELEALHGQGVKVDAVAVDPTGRWLASNGQHHEVSIWDLERSEVTTRLEGHSARVDGVDFSPDGSLLASGSWDGTVRLWELDSLSELRVLQGHERAVPFVAFSPKGDALTSVSWDGTVRWWDAATGDGRIVGHDPGRLYGVAFTQDGQSIVAASSDYHARLWPVEGGEPRVIAEHANEVNAIATSPQGELAVTGSDDTTVRLWRVADGTPFWHAPLLLTDPPRLLSHRGLERLSANPQEPRATTREVLPTWLADAAKRAKLGSASAQGDLVCMLTVDRELLTWRASSGERLSTRTLPDALEVLASPGGCLVREAKRAVHMPEAGGGSRVLVAEAEVRALGWAMGRALIATASEVIQVDSKGELVSSSPTTPGTSAVTLVKLDRQEAPALVVGYRDGGVELRRDDNNVPFERTSTSAVVRLLGGPAGTIVVGHADGALGLHDAANGQGIARAHLHGRVAHLLLTQDANASALYAASDLGSWLRWDLRVFSSDRCTFLRAVWRDVPVVWRSGSVQASEAPADHPCRTTTE